MGPRPPESVIALATFSFGPARSIFIDFSFPLLQQKHFYKLESGFRFEPSTIFLKTALSAPCLFAKLSELDRLAKLEGPKKLRKGTSKETNGHENYESTENAHFSLRVTCMGITVSPVLSAEGSD